MVLFANSMYLAIQGTKKHLKQKIKNRINIELDAKSLFFNFKNGLQKKSHIAV